MGFYSSGRIRKTLFPLKISLGFPSIELKIDINAKILTEKKKLDIPHHILVPKALSRKGRLLRKSIAIQDLGSTLIMGESELISE